VHKGVKLKFGLHPPSNLIGRSMNRPIACVIAQQYSSATSVSLRFHSRKGTLDAPFKYVTSFYFTF
jgi:hypothetical protein